MVARYKIIPARSPYLPLAQHTIGLLERSIRNNTEVPHSLVVKIPDTGAPLVTATANPRLLGRAEAVTVDDSRGNAADRAERISSASYKT